MQRMGNKLAVTAFVTGMLMVTSPSYASAVNTTTTISADAGPHEIGDVVVVDVNVVADGPGNCAGPVNVKMGARDICEATIFYAGAGVFSGSCGVRASDLVSGLNDLVAEFDGNTQCLASTSKPIVVELNTPPAPIPTTSEWTLWGLTGLLLIGGGVLVSRRFRAA